MANDKEKKLRDEQQQIADKQLKNARERLSLEERIQAVANKGIYGKGSAKALSQSTDVASFGNKSDLSSMEKTITNSLADVIKQTSKADATIKDQAEAKLQIQTLKKLADTLEGPYKKDIVGMVDKVREGVNQNASATKSTGKFITDQMGAMTLTMLSSVFDSPALAAVGGMISNFTDFRKEKKKEAREFELLAISEQAKEVAVDSAKLDEEATAKTHEFAELQQEKLDQANNTQQEIVDELVSTSDTQDDLLVEIEKNTKDIADNIVDISPQQNNDELGEKLDKLVMVGQDANDLAIQERRDARENLREANNKVGSGNRGAGVDGVEEDESFFDGKLVDMLQSMALLGGGIGSMITQFKKISSMVLAVIKKNVMILGRFGKILVKFVGIPLMLYNVLAGAIDGWKESDGASLGERIIESLQSAFGKLLDFVTFGLLDEESLEKASSKLSASGMLDGVFALVDSNIQMLTSIFEFMGDKLKGFAQFLGFDVLSDDEKIEQQQLQADQVRTANIEANLKQQGVELINRDYIGKDDLNHEALKDANLNKTQLNSLLNVEKNKLNAEDIQLIKDLLEQRAGAINAEATALDRVNRERNAPQESGGVTQVNNSVNNSNAMAVMGIPGTQNQNDSYTRFAK